jgi:hypothetical protein
MSRSNSINFSDTYEVSDRLNRRDRVEILSHGDGTSSVIIDSSVHGAVYVRVDDASLPVIRDLTWTIVLGGRSRVNKYAIHSHRVGGKHVTMYMHRMLRDVHRGDERKVDHKNGDTLDNRLSNLRITDARGNARNRKSALGGTSRYHGVYRVTNIRPMTKNIWRAGIRVDGRDLALGVHPSEQLAAQAYDEAARKYYGEYACVNFPRPGERCGIAA